MISFGQCSGMEGNLSNSVTAIPSLALLEWLGNSSKELFQTKQECHIQSCLQQKEVQSIINWITKTMSPQVVGSAGIIGHLHMASKRLSLTILCLQRRRIPNRSGQARPHYCTQVANFLHLEETRFAYPGWDQRLNLTILCLQRMRISSRSGRVGPHYCSWLTLPDRTTLPIWIIECKYKGRNNVVAVPNW